ncbi:MAG: rhodanese-like domain-containing protein [Deltaproteobacteria bacterium]|nr:rhodanese-like domain-containing protein [Deltaproteobacteria bacterium]
MKFLKSFKYVSMSIILLSVIMNYSVKNLFAYESKFAENISVARARDLLNNPENEEEKIIVIDIRTQGEFQFQGFIPRAYNIPYCFLGEKFVLVDQLYEYAPGEMRKAYVNAYPLVKNPDFIKCVRQVVKPNDKIIVYGRDSKLSSLAADEMVKAGYKKVMNMLGGLESKENGWKDAQFNVNYMLFIKDIDPKYIYQPDLENNNK